MAKYELSEHRRKGGKKDKREEDRKTQSEELRYEGS